MTVKFLFGENCTIFPAFARDDRLFLSRTRSKIKEKKEEKKKTSERILAYFLSDWLSRVEHTIKASVSLLSPSSPSLLPSLLPAENANERKRGEV